MKKESKILLSVIFILSSYNFELFGQLNFNYQIKSTAIETYSYQESVTVSGSGAGGNWGVKTETDGAFVSYPGEENNIGVELGDGVEMVDLRNEIM